MPRADRLYHLTMSVISVLTTTDAVTHAFSTCCNV